MRTRERRRRRREAVVNLADRCPGTRAQTMHEQCDIFIRSESSRTYTHIHVDVICAGSVFHEFSGAGGRRKKNTPEMRVTHRCREDPARNILLYIRRGRRNKKPEPHAPLVYIYYITVTYHRRVW